MLLVRAVSQALQAVRQPAALAAIPHSIATLQRAVAARTILHVCIDRKKKHEATDLAAALEIARLQAEEMKQYVVKAKEQHNIDAAVNLAATAKRLLGLVDEGEKLLS